MKNWGPEYQKRWKAMRLRLELELYLYKQDVAVSIEHLVKAMTKYGTKDEILDAINAVALAGRTTNDASRGTVEWIPNCVPAQVWRFKEIRYSSGCDEWGDPLPGYTLKVDEFTTSIERTTECGYIVAGKFIGFLWNRRRWIPDWAEALESYIARKKCHARHLERKLDDVESALRMANVRLNRFRSDQPNALTINEVGIIKNCVRGKSK